MVPQPTNLILTTDVPHGEGNVLVLDSLDTTWRLTDCWNGGDDFSQLQLVQDGGLTSSIETDLIEKRINSYRGRQRQKDYVRNRLEVRTHFLIAKKAGEQTGHGEAHDGSELKIIILTPDDSVLVLLLPRDRAIM
ncbi:hypothetical protein B0H19DRAFT_1151758 [Mycena capillaripes]|nr:hypothetical protein B0H19DRAFT_1151758 [Mycena capillaripes]